MNAIQIILAAERGQYIPKNFHDEFIPEDWGINPNTWAWQSTADPDHEDYWEAWDTILCDAEYIDENGDTWVLYHDGDLFAVCHDRMTPEEHQNFFGEEMEY